MDTPPPILLAGPTASGKSAVALRLAQRLGGEILSVDSMQVYRGLDVGTAKPSAQDRQRVVHHLLDVVECTEAFSAAQFVARATQCLADIRRRGTSPILCGGTGLYFKALLSGLGPAPPPDLQLRSELEATPMPVLLRELAERDPRTFATIDRNNPRRLVRALEVIRLSGQPFSAQRAPWPGQRAVVPGLEAARLYGLRRSPDDLRRRIDRRVDRMFELGLVEETARLLDRGLARNRAALQAIGYRQVAEYLGGERSLEQTIALVKRRTWQFARRQMTWFRHQLALEWVAVGEHQDENEVAELLLLDLTRSAADGAGHEARGETPLGG